MVNTQFSSSKVTLARANAKTKIDAMKEQNAAIRAKAGLEGNKIVKLKPMSDAVKAKVETRYGKR